MLYFIVGFLLLTNSCCVCLLFRHRHVPKAVFKAAKEKKIMLASRQRKYVLTELQLIVVNICFSVRIFIQSQENKETD